MKNRQTLLPVLLLGALLVLFFFDVLFLGRTVGAIHIPGVMADGPYGYKGAYTHRGLIDPGGSTWGPVPHTALISSMYRNGSWPLWNPYQGIGQPLAAGIDAVSFSPLRLPLYLHPSPLMWDLFRLFRLFLAGVFAYLFLASLGLSTLPALFSSLIFMLSGYFMFSIDMHYLDVEIFLPAMLLCFEKLARKWNDPRWWAASAAAVFLSVVGGQPQSTFLILCLAGAYYLFRVLTGPARPTVGHVGRSVAILSAVTAGGFGLSALQLFPFYEWYRISLNVHEPRPEHVLGLFSFGNVADIISFFVPYFMGPLHAGWLSGYDWHALTRGYFGVTAVLFLLTAVIAAVPRPSRDHLTVYFFGGVLLLLLAKLYGSPAVNWLGGLPIANMVNYTKYTGPLMAFSAAVLAGFGLEGIAHRKITGTSLLWAAVVVVATAAACFFFYYGYMAEHPAALAHLARASRIFTLSTRVLAALQVTLSLSFLGVLCAMGYLYTKKRLIGARAFQCAVIGVALTELFIYMPNPGPFKGRNLRYDILTPAPYVDVLKARVGASRLVGVEGMLYPDFASAFALRDIRSLDAFLSRRYVEFAGAFFRLPDPPDRFTGDEGIDFSDPGARRGLDLLGVRYILTGIEPARTDLVQRLMRQGGGAALSRDSLRGPSATARPAPGPGNRTLIVPTGTTLDVTTRIPAQGQLNFSIGTAPRGEAGKAAGAVLVEVRFSTHDKQRTIFTHRLTLPGEPLAADWQTFSCDLSPYAGEYGRLSFVTRPEGPVAADNPRVAWRDIVIERNSRMDGLTLVYDREARVYENPAALPRAFVAQGYEVVADKRALLARLKQPGFDPRSTILLERPPSGSGGPQAGFMSGDPSPSATVAIVRDEPSLVEVRADLRSPGFLVLTDLWYPGWAGYVDGRKAEILAADHVFRALPLAAGSHTVRFAYEPSWFRSGLWVSLAAFAAAIVLPCGMAARRRSMKG